MILIPKFLFETAAVIAKATNPIVKPLTKRTMKSNHSIALDQNFMFRRYPKKQKLKLTKTVCMR